MVGSRGCNATVDLLRDEPETSSWFDIWQAAVAVDKICVGRGYKGFSYVSGTSSALLPILGSVLTYYKGAMTI